MSLLYFFYLNIHALLSFVGFSQEALLANNAIPYNVDTVDSTSLRSSNRSPSSSVNETFWVPTINPRHPSTHSDAYPATLTGEHLSNSLSRWNLGTSPVLFPLRVRFYSYLDDSQPSTPIPTSPTGSHASMAMSTGSGNTVPIARTDKHVVLAMSPARPKVASMQAKLDHTKIEPSLYEQVNDKMTQHFVNRN